MTRIANIVSTGCYVPEIEVPNSVLDERFSAQGKPDIVSKFAERTNINTRWYAPDDWATSDLAVPACKQALERAGKKPEDVDLIILGTDSPDYLTPTTSVVLQKKIGAMNAGTFDIACACSTFPAGLAIGSGLIAANSNINTVLVVSVYMMRKLADPNDPMIFFYGDGAGAAVLEVGTETGFVGTSMIADGSYADAWGIYSSGTAEPVTHESIDAGRTTVKLVGEYPPEINLDGWPRLIKNLSDSDGFSMDEVDQVIFTQVNRGTIESVMNEVGIPVEKAHMVMDKWGYTGSACIPMCFDDAVQQGKIKKGDLVLFVGSGVGYNQAATAFRINIDLKK
ncbi:MAG: ketoacyl-ACP synthase III [Gammaproteobacteria bacterium]|nr:MAG: ketoacyl-ACP synthase III [Gammaproteobacteria bacterium]